MVEQFLRVADELGWDINTQIDKLEEFTDYFGVAGRLDEYLVRRGLVGSARRDVKCLRDGLLDFVELLGNRGAMNHFLQHALQEAAARVRAEEAAKAAAHDAVVRAGRHEPGQGVVAWIRNHLRPHA